jgi:AraC-like DNA-binding protein
MSRIIFEDEYVIVVPSFDKVALHKHSFYHIFFLGEKEECDEIYVTGSGMVHTMPSRKECRLFLMIDPTSNLADYLHSNVLWDDHPKRIKVTKTFHFIEDLDEESLKDSVNSWLKENSFSFEKNANELVEDYRVVRLIQEIRDYKHLEKKIDEIAKEYNLSKSRLSHAFKENVGISLKGYLLIVRLKYVYKLVMEGKSKTYASVEGGFTSPAHLAYICKKQMGISISDVMK